MRSINLLKVAAEAEILRLRILLARQGKRAAFGVVAVIFVLGVFVLAEVAGWQVLRFYVPPIPATLSDLVAIQAEGDYVTLSFVKEYDDPSAPGKKYTTTWFDMLRVVNGKLVEHWDSATKGAVGPAAASVTKK